MNEDYLTDKVRANNSRAIALLTAAQPGSDGSQNLLPDILVELTSDEQSTVDLLFGLSNIAGLLLVRLEKLAGRQPLEELRYLAAKYGER